MNRYVSEILSTAQKLQDVGNPVYDTLLAVILLAELPNEYKPTVTALENSGRQITTDLVKKTGSSNEMSETSTSRLKWPSPSKTCPMRQ